jgi:hypothetical protein
MLCSGWWGGRDGLESRAWIVTSNRNDAVRLLDWLPWQGSDAFETVACVGTPGFSPVQRRLLEYSHAQQ